MADADGKMTGRPGVAFVTRGPGATNASGGVHVAFQDSTPMILFIGDVARGDRDREGFQEIDFPAFFAPDRQMGGADRGCAAHPRICRPRLPRRDRRPARPGRARAARGHAARRGRGARPPVRPAARRGARSRRGPGDVRAAEGRDQPGRDRRRRRLEPARGAPFRQLRLPLRHPRRRRLPPPGRDLQHAARSMPASSATAPTPSSSSASATPT